MESYKNEDKTFHSQLKMPRRKQNIIRNEEL